MSGGVELEAEKIEPRRPQRRMVGQLGGCPLRRRGEGGKHDRGGEEGPENRWGKRGHRYGPFRSIKSIAAKMCPGNKSDLKE
jgi:hypothetical protein